MGRASSVAATIVGIILILIGIADIYNLYSTWERDATISGAQSTLSIILNAIDGWLVSRGYRRWKAASTRAGNSV